MSNNERSAGLRAMLPPAGGTQAHRFHNWRGASTTTLPQTAPTNLTQSHTTAEFSSPALYPVCVYTCAQNTHTALRALQTAGSLQAAKTLLPAALFFRREKEKKNVKQLFFF